jgi:hypothetical protein
VAGLCACVVFTGNLDADDLGTAAFKSLFHEEAEKNPTVPPAVIAANILTYTERDMSIERVDFVGSPLRGTGTTLSAKSAARCSQPWRSSGSHARRKSAMPGSSASCRGNRR